MSGGGGFAPQGQQNSGPIPLPEWAREPIPGVTTISWDEQKEKALDDYYRTETMKRAQASQPPSPQEQMVQATRLIMRESAQGRIPDPDYDIMPRAADAYKKIDYGALALQRARDFANDLDQEMAAKGKPYSKAERERIISNRQAEELKRLTETTASDDERAKARDDRRMRLMLGQMRLKPGASLLDDENKTGSGTTLLAG